MIQTWDLSQASKAGVAKKRLQFWLNSFLWTHFLCNFRDQMWLYQTFNVLKCMNENMCNLSKFWGKFLKNDWRQSCCLIGQMSDDIENDKREENEDPHQEWKSLWWWCHLLLLHNISFLLCLYKLSPTAAMNKGQKFKQTNHFHQDYLFNWQYLKYVEN